MLKKSLNARNYLINYLKKLKQSKALKNSFYIRIWDLNKLK